MYHMTTDTSDDRDADDQGLAASVTDAVHGLRERAHVGTVFGEPVEHGEKTVIPVARVAYVFGAGAGSGPEEDPDSGEGSGGGGGMAASPVGVVEITDRETRVVPFADRKRFAIAVGLGLLVGYLFGRK